MAQNLPLQTALETISEHPELHDQGTWATLMEDDIKFGQLVRPKTVGPKVDCGTVMCVAGLGCVQNGYAFVQTAYDGFQGGMNAVVQIVPGMPKIIDIKENKYELLNAASVGQEIFDLDDTEADAMFVSGNDLEDLWALAYAVTDGDISLAKAKDRDGVPITSERILTLLLAWEENPEEAPMTDDCTHAIIATDFFHRKQAGA